MKHRGGSAIGVLTASAVAIAAAVLLVLLFSHSTAVRREAERLNFAVTVCRSTADAYLAGGTFTERLAEMGYAPKEAENGTSFEAAYENGTLEITLAAEPEGAVEAVTVTATEGEETVYTLETKRVVSSVERQGALQ